MSIARFMCDEIAISTFLNDNNRHGQPSYLAPVIVKARVVEGRKVVRGANGTDQDITTTIATMAVVGIRDRIWIAPLSSNNAPRVFPPAPQFVDADARSPVDVKNARKRIGNDGHFEVVL